MDFPLAVFLPHALVARQAGLLPGRQLVAAGGPDAEGLVSLGMPSPERDVSPAAALRWKFTAWCHLRVLPARSCGCHSSTSGRGNPRGLPGGNYTTATQRRCALQDPRLQEIVAKHLRATWKPCGIPSPPLWDLTYRQHFPELLLLPHTSQYTPRAPQSPVTTVPFQVPQDLCYPFPPAPRRDRAASSPACQDSQQRSPAAMLRAGAPQAAGCC